MLIDQNPLPWSRTCFRKQKSKTSSPAEGTSSLWASGTRVLCKCTCYCTKMGFSYPTHINKPINYGVSFWERNQFYSMKLICRETGDLCPQICLPDSGFGVKFNRLQRTGWHTEMLAGQVLIGGLQAFMVRWGRNFNTRSS